MVLRHVVAKWQHGCMQQCILQELKAIALLILRCMEVTASPMQASYVTPGTYLPQHPPAAAAAVTYSQSSADIDTLRDRM